MFPKPYLDYLLYFHAEHDYFECHEVLEEYWKEKNLQETHWVSLIQLAVGLYHHRRGNMRGAHRMLTSALRQVRQHKSQLTELGIKPDELEKAIESRITEIKEHIAYTDFSIPLLASVEEICKNMCQNKGVIWKSASAADEFLIHKHTLRNRDEIIAERERQKQLKQRKKGD